MCPESDIDLLIVASPLPDGRMARVEEFTPVENALEDEMRDKEHLGIHTRLSPLFKTPREIAAHSPILLDMTQDARLLYDRDDFFQQQLNALRKRLKEWGAKRVFTGNAWWWDVKRDFKPGEVFEIGQTAPWHKELFSSAGVA